MFKFFSGFDSEFVESAWTMREVFRLTTRMFLAFGVAFELPVVVFFLAVGRHRRRAHPVARDALRGPRDLHRRRDPDARPTG